MGSRSMQSASREWPWWWTGMWVVMAGVVVCLQGPRFVEDLRPPIDERIHDFLQEYGSVRNWRAGKPLYGNQGEAAALYLNYRQKPDEVLSIRVNAHPPTAIFLVLPLAWFE